MQYCQVKHRVKKHCYKHGFLTKVICDKRGKVDLEKYRPRVVCKGVAAELELRTNGRRNMLGAVVSRRR